ncbi:MAG: 50S ribosomal protein L9 [Bacillota bacterium]|nr:50S ribosomal protein L9 [Bacillota bacterium]
MKVILLQDIKNMGKKGDVVNASDGHARNYLFPRNLAQEATQENLHIINQKKENERKKKLAETEEAQALAERLKGKEVKILVKCGESGRLFGAITNKDVAESIKKQYNIDVEKKKVFIDTIKQVGVYEAEVKLYAEISTKMKVVVSEQ